jgi:tetratricopeptide (TPR) repeat protein
MKQLKILCLLLSVLVFFAPSAWAATLEDAEKAFRAGQYKEAYRLYFILLREDPESDAVNIGLARSALASGHMHQAIMAYERVIAKYPAETGFYYEIAQAYLAVGDKETARRYLQNDQNLDPIGMNIMMNKLGERYERWYLRSRLRFGVLYDSNANNGLNSNNVNIGGLPLILIDGEKISTPGAYLGGNFDWSWRQTRDGNLWTVGDAQFYTRYGFNNDLRRLKSEYYQWYRLATGVRRIKPESYFDIRIKGEVFDYDFSKAVYAVGPEITYVKSLNPTWQLITSGNIDWRDYKRDNRYNGTYGSAGQYARMFFGKQKHEFVFGGRYSFAHADFKDYSYDSLDLYSGWRFKLKNGFELSPSASYVWDNYKGPATFIDYLLGTGNRADQRMRLGLGVTYRISEAFSLDGSYNYTRSTSNSALFRYNRHLVTFGGTYNF